MNRLRKLVGGLVVAGALAAVAPSLAAAGTEHYCAGGLSAGWRCASGNAHSVNSMYVEVVTDHTACAAVGWGFGGYSPSGSVSLVACTSGSGTMGGWRNAVSDGHGAVYNPNGSTTDYIYDAHASW